MWLVTLAFGWAGTAWAGPAEDLIVAATRGDAAAVKALLAKKTDVNAERNDGATALILASQDGYLDVVRVLLLKGANVNAKANNGATALILASGEGHLDVVQALLAKGADINAKTTIGQTALMLASWDGRFQVVQALLAKGAEVNDKETHGQTVLMFASGNLNVTQALLAKGADVNAKRNDGTTALILASFNGSSDVVQALLAKGADVNAKTNDGRTALDAATAGGHDGIKTLLVQAGTKAIAADAVSGKQNEPDHKTAISDLNVAEAKRPPFQAVGWIEELSVAFSQTDLQSGHIDANTSASHTHYVLRCSDKNDYLLIFVNFKLVTDGINIGSSNRYSISGEVADIPPYLSADANMLRLMPNPETGTLEARTLSHVILVQSIQKLQ
jgi:ankyrin repeat protein